MKKVAVVYLGRNWQYGSDGECRGRRNTDSRCGGGLLFHEHLPLVQAKMDEYDAVAFGCPSMGVEQLEDSEFEPMFQDCESKLSGKKTALFGSYGWGDGEWMRNWESTCKEDGAVLACDSVICNDAPDDDVIEACKSLGASLA